MKLSFEIRCSMEACAGKGETRLIRASRILISRTYGQDAHTPGRGQLTSP
ncbi:hypothetical protein [Methanocalculus sp. MSAO_Arc2]